MLRHFSMNSFFQIFNLSNIFIYITVTVWKLQHSMFQKTFVLTTPLKGEAILHAILPSHMKGSYSTSGCFPFLALQTTSFCVCCLSHVKLYHAHVNVITRYKNGNLSLCQHILEGVITHLRMWQSTWCNHSFTLCPERDLAGSPFNFLELGMLLNFLPTWHQGPIHSSSRKFTDLISMRREPVYKIQWAIMHNEI